MTRRFFSVFVSFDVLLILVLALLLCAGDNHTCVESASCPGCLRAPIAVHTTPVVVETTLTEFGFSVVSANPQPLSALLVSFTSLRAPPAL
jgi:hypothetical protein